MGGDDKYSDDLNFNKLNIDADDCCKGTGCGCGCGCKDCDCRVNHAVDNGANRNHYGSEGGQKGVLSLPIPIPTKPKTEEAHDFSFDEHMTGYNDAPQPLGASLALTYNNITQHNGSDDNAPDYHVRWLRDYAMRIDENPFAAFVSTSPADENEMPDFERQNAPVDLDGSLYADHGSELGDNRSTTSRSSCHRSRSSRSQSQIIGHMNPTGSHVFHPLALTPEPHLPELLECTCPNCGMEHD